MSGFVFKPATRENVSLLLGVCGGTGSGKSWSANRLATGLSGGKRFAVIDTEAGRAKHYAGDFTFDHGDLKAPFRPAAYVEAIKAADEAGYPCIVVDSMSHVWAGDGGVLEWQEEELDRMAGEDWKKREACKMAAWIRPKMAHKGMVSKLLQLRAHVILCFRAEQKIEMVKNKETGRLEVLPKQSLTGLDGWIPVCEKNLPFELTASFLLTADKPGVPHPIKLPKQFQGLIQPGKEIDEKVGEGLARWAAGGSSSVPAPKPSPRTDAAKQPSMLADDEAAAMREQDDDPAESQRRKDQEAALGFIADLHAVHTQAELDAVTKVIQDAKLNERVKKLIEVPYRQARDRAKGKKP